MRIVSVGTSDFTNLWQRLFLGSEFQYPLFQPWNIGFYQAYAPESRFTDCSFVVEEQRLPLLGMRMASSMSPKGHRELSGWGLPLLYMENQDVDSSRLRGAHKLLTAEFNNILQGHSITTVIYQDFLNQGRLSFLGQHLLDIGAQAIPYFTQMIDLSASETDLRSQIRKSYKSLINWGKKNLSLRVLDSETIAPEDIERFRQLHIHASGRETRSPQTWEVQYEMVCHEEAFVVLGELEAELVTAALFPCSSRYCYYGVSASKRELFDKPLSHSVMWRAMIYAKEHGCRFFETGRQHYPRQGDPLPTQKELSISTFKRGFGGQTHLRLRIVWQQ